MLAKISGLLTVSMLTLGDAANADVSISSKPTANMSCDAGVCTATAQKAVLNVTDLQAMLAGGDVAVKTGSIAKDIDVDQPLSWSSTARLTLDAQQSVQVNKQVTVAGTGNLTIVTNDGGGKKGEFIIVPEHGSVQFWDLASSLIIDRKSYMLVNDIKTLAADIAANPSGFYALAKPYDASVDGTYAGSAVPGTFPGSFEGLGNTISNFSMLPTERANAFGFFEETTAQGVIRDLGLIAVNIGGRDRLIVGTLTGTNGGAISGCWATGTLTNVGTIAIAGLVSVNGGNLSRSFSRVNVTGNFISYAGGLVGANDGHISQTYATGTVKVLLGGETDAGGLVGYNDAGDGLIVDSYALGAVHDGRDNCCYAGGLVGENGNGATITSTYTAGHITEGSHGESLLGGVVGFDDAIPGSIQNAYWDLDKGISDPSKGAGNIPNDPGITGLSDVQLKSDLPFGFDPKVWGSDPKVNHGYPYLLRLPPK